MPKYYKKYYCHIDRLIYFLIFLSFTALHSQVVKVFDLNSSNYPNVTSKFIYLDEFNNQVQSNFDIFLSENAKQVSNLNITHFNSQPIDYSALLSIDISESVNGNSLEIVKSFLSEIITITDTSKGELALQCFNNFNYLLSSYTKNTENLLLTLPNIKPYGTTDFDNCFLNENFSAKNIIKDAKHKKYIVLVNDGTAPISETEVSKLLTDNNITLFVITINTKTPKILQNLVDLSSGYSFDFINSKESAANIARIINYLMKGLKPSELSWFSDECGLEKKLFCNITSTGISDFSNYSIKESQIPKLIITPQNYDFGFVQQGTPKDQKIKIKASGKDFILSDYLDNNIFKLLGLTKNHLLKNGDEIEVIVRYQPIDTFYTNSEIKILANSCFEDIIYLSGGSPLSNPKNPSLKVVYPNGGELLNAGGSSIIKWSGILNTDTVSIEYSIDNGKIWTNLTNAATGKEFLWSPIPNINSKECLIRIKQNATIRDFSKVIRLPQYMNEIISINWTNDGKELIVSTKDGFIRVWDIEKLQVNRTIAENINQIRKAALNDNNQYISVLTDTSTVIPIYDKQNGGLISILEGDGSPLTDISWNETGNLIAASTKTGKIILWEYPSSTPQLIINSHQKSLTSISFSKNGTLISVGTEDGFTKIFELNGTLKHNLYNYDYKINNVDWNSSGSVIAVAGDNENIKIWDLASENNVLTINNKIKPTNFISWQPDNSQLFSLQNNNSIYIWEPANGNLKYEFPLHSGIVNCISWNKTGDLIASGSKNGEVFIWSPKDIPFEKKSRQEDVSNSVFTISLPMVISKAVNFGTVEIDEIAEIQVAEFLKNISDNSIRVDSIVLHGDTKNYFELQFDSLRTLNKNDIFNLNATFAPNKIGVFADTILVFLDYKVEIVPIFGICIEKILTVSPNFLNFDSLNIFEISNSQSINLKNNSNTEITITTPVLFGDVDNSYTTEMKNNISIPANSSVNIDFNFTPKTKGIKPVFCEIGNLTNQSKQKILLYGTATAPKIEFDSIVNIGSVQCLGYKDSIITIHNAGNGSLFIKNFSNSNSNFKLNPNLSEYTIKSNDSLKIEITFSSNDYQINYDTITFTTNATETGQNNWKYFFEAKRDTLNLELSENSLLFYDVSINTPTTRSIFLKNTGTTAIDFPFPIDFTYFEIDKVESGMINPNETVELIIKFKGAANIGLYHQNYDFITNCGNIFPLKMVAYIGNNNSFFNTVSSIDFPAVICDFSLVDSTIIIRNTGTTPLLIHKFSLTDDLNFIVDLPNKEIVLLPDEFIDFVVYYTPQSVNIHNAELIFETNASNSIEGLNKIKLSGKKEKLYFEVLSDTINFIDVLENIPTDSTFFIKNTGTIPVEVNFSNLIYFEILNSKPIIIQPNTEIEIFIKFKSGKDGDVFQEELFIEDSCNNKQVVILSANVTGFAPAGLSIGKYQAEPGEIIDIPIILYSPKETDLPDVIGYTATLSLNSTLLVPQNSSIIQKLSNNTREIEIEILKNGEWQLGEVARIKFKATLGDTNQTELKLSNVNAINSVIKVESTDGLFELNGICIDSTERLIEGNNILRLLQNYPNPASVNTSIAYEIIEDGWHSLEIYNYFGQKISVLISEYKKAGVYNLIFDVRELPIGTYYLLLTTPSQQRSRKLVIIR